MTLQYSWWKLAVWERSNPLTGRLRNFQAPPEQYIASVKWKFPDSFRFRIPQQMEEPWNKPQLGWLLCGNKIFHFLIKKIPFHLVFPCRVSRLNQQKVVKWSSPSSSLALLCISLFSPEGLLPPMMESCNALPVSLVLHFGEISVKLTFCHYTVLLSSW